MALGLGNSCARASGSNQVPVPSWATTQDAQRDARLIESAWHDGSDRERLATKPLLVRFIDRYPDDPKVQAIRLRLAWLMIQANDLDAAERVVQDVSRRVSGADGDNARILQASLLARRGQAVAALAQLRALGGGLVDGEARELWAEEAVRVAFLAHAPDDAVSLMLAWRIIVSDEHLARAEQEIQAGVDRLEASARLRALEVFRTAAAQPSAEESRQRARVWLREVIRASLGRFAESTHNGLLARRLVADAPTKYLRTPEGEQLRRLAQSSDAPDSVMHAAIGLLLELDDDHASRQSAELVTGAMRALATVSKEEPVRLVTRELRASDTAEVERALVALATDGAAILIAGLSPRTATVAARVAEAQHIPVVLLAEPSDPVQSGSYLFVLESPAPQVERLFGEAGAESRKKARLSADDAFCRAEESLGWTPAFLSSHADLLITADAACATRLADALRTREAHVKVWLGPDAATAASAFEDASVITSSPLLQRVASQPVAQWQERFQRLPTWQEAKGYDVARLGIEAIRHRGFESLRGEPLVRAAREKIRDQLARAECELMTTTDRGFRGTAMLRTTMVMQRLRAAPRAEKAGQ